MRPVLLLALLLVSACAPKLPPADAPNTRSLDATLRPYLGVMLWEDCEHEKWPHAWVRISADSVQLAGVNEEGNLWVSLAFVRVVQHEQTHLRQVAKYGCQAFRDAKQWDPDFVERMEAEAQASESIVRNRKPLSEQ
jgi:hypothetical protein